MPLDSNGTKTGIYIALEGKKSAIDARLHGGGGSVLSVFEGRSYPTMPIGLNWVTYSLTKPASGLLQSDVTEYDQKLAPVGSFVTDMQLEFDLPPLVNTLTNVQHDGSALGLTAGAVLAFSNITTAAGTFTDAEAVTISGAGTGFTGTVNGLTGPIPTAITTTDSGSAYAAANITITGGTSGATATADITIGNKLTTHPPTNGRIVLPAPSGGQDIYGGSLLEMGAASTTDANKDTLGNSIISEAMSTNLVTKVITGITIAGGAESQMQRVRAGGLATTDLAAHYCRWAPAHLLNEISIRDATSGAWITAKGDDAVQYHEWFDRKRLSRTDTGSSDDVYDLKEAAMRPQTLRMRVPFNMFHQMSQAFPIEAVRDTDIMVKVKLNGWASILKNSPTYNTNVAVATSATAAAATVPATVTYTPAFATYTTANGAFTDTQICLMEKATQTTGSAPSTALLNKFFQARLRVQYAHVPRAVQMGMHKGYSKTSTICQFQAVDTQLFNSASDSTVNNVVTAKFPMAYMYAVNRLNHNVLLNDQMNYHCVRDPLTRHRRGSAVDGGRGPSFFQFIRFKLSDNSVLDFPPDIATDMLHRKHAVHQPERGNEMYLLPFTNGNPFDEQKLDSTSLSSLDFKAIEYVTNPQVFTNQEFVGGLPTPNFTTTVRGVNYNTMTVSSEGGVVVRHLN
jgi:hypothetical protein